jgi:polysaccharide pyruvyl transferase WcaK-like protein
MIHHVYANRSNIGDWLAARGIQSLLDRFQVVEHFCDEPFVPETLRQLAATTERDFIIIGGGGLFMDYFTPFWEGFRDIARRTPFCVWGVGCCDHKLGQSRASRDLLDGILQQSRLSIVRDRLTRDYLRPFILPPPITCPAINAVTTPPGDPTARLLHVDHLGIIGDVAYEFMCRTAERFATRTNRSYRKFNNLIRAGDTGALAKALEQYASADLVLTSRLHGCIIAVAMGRRVLAVSGDGKVDSFMHSAGLGEWVIDLANLDSLPTRLAELPQQPSPREFVETARQANADVASRVRLLAGRSLSDLTKA